MTFQNLAEDAVSFVNDMLHLEGRVVSNGVQSSRHSSVLIDQSILIVDIDVRRIDDSPELLKCNEYRIVQTDDETVRGFLEREDFFSCYFGSQELSNRGLIFHVPSLSEETLARVTQFKEAHPCLAFDIARTPEELRLKFNNQIKENYFNTFIDGFCNNLSVKLGADILAHIQPNIETLKVGWVSGNPDFKAFEDDCKTEFEAHLLQWKMPAAKEMLIAFLSGMMLGLLVFGIIPFMMYLQACVTLKMGVIAGTIAYNVSVNKAILVGCTVGAIAPLALFRPASIAAAEVRTVNDRLKSSTMCASR